MDSDQRFAIRIEGDPVTDELIRDVVAYARQLGLKPTTAARILIRKALREQQGLENHQGQPRA